MSWRSAEGRITVLSATNLSTSLANWNSLGGALEISPGLFQFTDAQATASLKCFYRVLSP
jgi:hypothetical protein